MTELYRGLLLVLTTSFNKLIETLREHIRTFKQQTRDEDNFLDVGVLGFWNLLLEIVFTLYILMCLTSGIFLTAGLAIMAYPFVALLTYSSNLLVGTRGKQPKDLHIIKVANDTDQEKK